MQRLEVSGAVRLIYKSLGVKGLNSSTLSKPVYIHKHFGETYGFIPRKNRQHTHKEKLE